MIAIGSRPQCRFRWRLHSNIYTSVRGKTDLSAIHDGLRREEFKQHKPAASRFRNHTHRDDGRGPQTQRSYGRDQATGRWQEGKRYARTTGDGKSGGFAREEEGDNRKRAFTRRGSSSQGSGFSPRFPYTTAASQFLYGSSVVQAALKAKRRELYNLYVKTSQERDSEGSLTALRTVTQWVKEAGVNVKINKVDHRYSDTMNRISEGRPHNGCILEASPLPNPQIKSLRSVSASDNFFEVECDERFEDSPTARIPHKSTWRQPFVLLLDGVKDEGNLGGIIRSAYYLGVDAVVVTKRSSASLTPVTLKASAGAAEALPILTVFDASGFAHISSKNGWKVYAADAPEEATLSEDGSAPPPSTFQFYEMEKKGKPQPVSGHSPLTQHPTLLMLGSEGDGLSWALRDKADYIVGITPYSRFPLDIGVDSLNVSVSAGLLAAEFLQRAAQNAKKGDAIIDKPFERGTGQENERNQRGERIF